MPEKQVLSLAEMRVTAAVAANIKAANIELNPRRNSDDVVTAAAIAQAAIAGPNRQQLTNKSGVQRLLGIPRKSQAKHQVRGREIFSRDNNTVHLGKTPARQRSTAHQEANKYVEDYILRQGTPTSPKEKDVLCEQDRGGQMVKGNDGKPLKIPRQLRADSLRDLYDGFKAHVERERSPAVLAGPQTSFPP
jgi:hypothetical protein